MVQKKPLGNKKHRIAILKLWNVDVYNLPSDKIILHDTLDVRMTIFELHMFGFFHLTTSD